LEASPLTYGVYCPARPAGKRENGRQLSTRRKDSFLGEIANRRHVHAGDTDDEPRAPEGRTDGGASAGRRSRLAEPARRDSDLTAAEAGHGLGVGGLHRAELTT